MKCHFLLGLLFSILVTPLFSQRTLKEIDENKYKINLPDHWSPQNKAFQILADILPTLCPELKDKDLCGDDCNPAWTVKMYITEPILIKQAVYSKPNPTPITNTQKSFVRKDQYISRENPQPTPVENNLSNRPLTGNQSGKVHVIFYTFQCFLLLEDKDQKINTRLVLVDTNETWEKSHTYTRGSISASKLPSIGSAALNRLMPQTDELLAIADKKIIALGKGE